MGTSLRGWGGTGGGKWNVKGRIPNKDKESCGGIDEKDIFFCFRVQCLCIVVEGWMRG